MKSTPSGRDRGSASRLLTADAAGLCICLALAGVWYARTIAPLQEARAARNALVAELEPRIQKRGDLVQQTRVQQQTLAGVGQQIAQGELQLRNVDQINHRLAELTSIAAQYGLRLEEVRPAAPVAMQWFITVPIRLSGTGKYPRIGAFLHALPTEFPDVAVVGFEVRGEPEADDREPRFVLSLVWYAAPRTGGGQK